MNPDLIMTLTNYGEINIVTELFTARSGEDAKY